MSKGVKNSNKDTKKERITYILVFYYLFILLMPFERGTASIAEMAFYSLWDTYISEYPSIKLNSFILFDVEALTLPFNTFYKNFFEKDEDDITGYTPYWINQESSNDR